MSGRTWTLSLVVCLVILAPALSALPPSPDVRASSRAGLSIIKGPYLQNVTLDNITVVWETNLTGNASVEYGLTASYGSIKNGTDGLALHSVTLTDLLTNTTYHYRVRTNSTYSADNIFRTAKQNGQRFTFAVYGDTRTNHTAHKSVVSRMNLSNPEFVLSSGDLVGNGSLQSDFDAFFSDLDGMIGRTPYYPAIGNHDLPGTLYQKYFSLPNNERWYSFDYGSAHFTVLDTTQSYNNTSAQYQWLVDDLTAANATANWKFVLFHHPAFSSSLHKSTPAVQQYLVPVFEDFKVDAVFNGHDHNYEHAMVNGTHYLVAGAGGAPLYANGTSAWTVYSESTYHFVNITIDGNVAYFEGIRPDGTTFDKFNITKNDHKAPAPVSITVKDTGLGRTVDIDWSSYDEVAQGDVAGYNIYYSTEDFTTVEGMLPNWTLSAGFKTKRLYGPPDDLLTYFAVTAVDTSQNENKSVATVSAIATDITAPERPTGLALSDIEAHSMNLTWDANYEPDLAGYIVWYGEADAGHNYTLEPFDNIVVQANRSFVDGLLDETEYCFAIQAVDLNMPPNPSNLSDVVCGVTAASPPPQPPVNNPPMVYEQFPWVHFYKGTPAMDQYYDLYWNFYDVEYDTLTFNITYSDINCSILYRSFWSAYLLFNISPSWSGYGHINVTGTNDQGSVWANLTVNVSAGNQAPFIWAPSEWYTYEGRSSILQFKMWDPDNQVNELSVETDIFTFAQDANLRVDLKDQLLILFPDNRMVGELDFHIRAVDPMGERSEPATIHLVVVNTNDPPTVEITAPLDNQVFKTSQIIDFRASGADPDLLYGDFLVYSWTLDGFGVIAYAQAIQYRLEPGVHKVIVEVKDRYGANATAIIFVRVVPDDIVPPPPGPEPEPEPELNTTSTGEMILGGMCCAVIIVVLILIIFVVSKSSKPATGPAQGYPNYGYQQTYGYPHGYPRGYPPQYGQPGYPPQTPVPVKPASPEVKRQTPPAAPADVKTEAKEVKAPPTDLKRSMEKAVLVPKGLPSDPSGAAQSGARPEPVRPAPPDDDDELI